MMLQEKATDSEKEINRLSILPFPPSAGSILRRQREEDPAPAKRLTGWEESHRGPERWGCHFLKQPPPRIPNARINCRQSPPFVALKWLTP